MSQHSISEVCGTAAQQGQKTFTHNQSEPSASNTFKGEGSRPSGRPHITADVSSIKQKKHHKRS